ncbi:hypothetical protein PUN28_015951 [Cardiocondyla obscurior]|uniref:Uncharacterized protein n=1 Tax=Cardiocondyla obscurior TaxID=286306 RepID=A0AAW2ESP6_9HYME
MVNAILRCSNLKFKQFAISPRCSAQPKDSLSGRRSLCRWHSRCSWDPGSNGWRDGPGRRHRRSRAGYIALSSNYDLPQFSLHFISPAAQMRRANHLIFVYSIPLFSHRNSFRSN